MLFDADNRVKDERPRRRTLFKSTRKGANAFLQSQGVEASYLGSSSLAILVWKHVPQTADAINRLRGIDDRHDLYRGSIGGLEQNGLLVGQNDSEPAKVERPVLVSVSQVQSKLSQELGSETILASCMLS